VKATVTGADRRVCGVLSNPWLRLIPEGCEIERREHQGRTSIDRPLDAGLAVCQAAMTLVRG